MPSQKGKSSLLAKLGTRGAEAWEQHKTDETRWGRQDLPAGIKGGTAQLVTAELKEADETKKYPGQPYVNLTAIAIKPKEFKDCPVEGLRVNQTIYLCDQKDRQMTNEDGTKRMRTQADGLRDLMDEFRKLLGEEALKDTTVADIETILAGLQQSKPFTRFSTRGWTPPKKKPTDPEPTEMVFVQFDGVCDPPAEYVNGDGEQSQAATEDETGDEEPADTEEEETAADAEQQEEEEETTADEPDLNSLAEAADVGKGKRREMPAKQLTEMASKAGCDADAVENAANWGEVVEMIRTAQGGEDASESEEVSEEETEAEAEEFVPSKGSVYHYTLKDAKGKPMISAKTKKPLKPVEVEVLTVSAKSDTVTVKNLDSGDTIMDAKTKKALNIPWAELSIID